MLSVNFELILQALPFGVAQLDAQQRFIFANCAFYKILELDLNALPEFETLGLLKPSGESYYDLLSGRRIFLRWKYQPFKQGSLLMIEEITEAHLREVYESRKARMHDLSEMAALVAHAVRNPLGGIRGFASLLERDLEGQSELLKMTEYIVKGADTVNMLIQRMLQYCDPLDINLQFVSLEEIIRKCIEESPFKTILFEVKSNVSQRVDAHLIQKVLINLLENAHEATENKQMVQIILDAGNSGMHLWVIDQGTGIPLENKKKIFSPFFTTKVKGSGLGLAEVQKIIQAHEGEIFLECEEGKGTSVHIWIPMR